jgi:PKD repeat protein
VSFSSAGSRDLDGTIFSYAWDFGDGATSTLANPSHTYTTAGPYVVTLTVTDNTGAATTQAILVKATEPNRPPVAVAAAVPTSGPAPLDVIFYADGSYDPDGFIGNIHWTFSDGWDYWGSPAYHTFNSDGMYTATLTVYDSRGGTGTTSLTIRVGAANRPPTAVASANPTSGPAPLTVNFSSAGSTDLDGRITSYAWNFGDGATTTLANPSHTYASPGTYAATLTVTDDHGATSSASLTITATGSLRSTAINLTARLRAGTVTVNGQVVVQTASGAAVPGATVLVTWTLPGGATANQTATTDSTGVAKFRTRNGRGTYTLSVTNITKSGYTFDRATSVLSKSITK